MVQKIKEIISSFFKLKKAETLVLLFIVILGIIVPLHHAWAFVDLLAGLIAEYAIAFIVQFAVTICNLLLHVFTALLMWVTGPYFINLSYTGLTTSSGVQTIVGVGWELTRSLTNIIFILAMVAIGLGTALRIGDYEAKKALPRLIGIALLINFTPVILGVIVDATNIVMNFFLSELSGVKLLASTFGAQGAILLNVLKGWFNPLAVAQSILQGLMLIIFDIGAALIFFLFSLLFALRYIAIWMLVILSPFAFACYILPATKKFFNQWWDQFIQWSIIGMTGAFFLYLGNHMLAMAGQGIIKLSSPESGFLEKYILSFMADMVPFMLALAFLFIGFMMALQTSAMGASGLTKGIKVGMNKLGKWAGKTALGTLGRRVGPRVEALGKRMEQRGMESTMGKGVFTKAMRFGQRWTGRGFAVTGGRLFMGAKIKDEDEINAGKKEATNKDSADNFRKINEELLKGPLANWNKVAGLLVGTRENGDGDDIEDAFFSEDPKKAVLRQHLPKLKNIIEAGQRAGPPGYRPVVKALFGHIITNPKEFGYNAEYDETTGDIKDQVVDARTGKTKYSDKDIETLRGFIKKIPEKMNSGDFQGYAVSPKNFNPKTKEGRFFIQTMLRERGADFMPQFARRANRKEQEGLLQFIFKSGEFVENGLGKEWLLENGAEDVLRYMDSPGARSAGIGIGESRPEIENLIAERMMGKTDEELGKERGILDARLQKAKREGVRNQGLNKIKNQITRIDREFDLRKKTIDELSQEITEKVKRRVAINNIEVEKRTVNLYTELAQIEETLRRDNAELKRKVGQSTIEVELPVITPRATAKELGQFREIARGAMPIPERGKLENRLRNIRGAIRESFNFQEGVRKEIKEAEDLMKEATARGEAASVFENKLRDLENRLGELQTKERELKDNQNQLEEEALKKK